MRRIPCKNNVGRDPETGQPSESHELPRRGLSHAEAMEALSKSGEPREFEKRREDGSEDSDSQHKSENSPGLVEWPC